eukprot:480891-Hanusia_phi.AAC.1
MRWPAGAEGPTWTLFPYFFPPPPLHADDDAAVVGEPRGAVRLWRERTRRIGVAAEWADYEFEELPVCALEKKRMRLRSCNSVEFEYGC